MERFKLIDGGEGIEVNVHVEDPGAFTMPWNAIQRYRRDQRSTEVPLRKMVCAENNGGHFNQNLYPTPQADKPDFCGSVAQKRKLSGIPDASYLRGQHEYAVVQQRRGA